MHQHTRAFRRAGRLLALRSAEDRGETAEAVNAMALRPLAPEEYAVFLLDLCHNETDRHYSRFPEEELETINALTPGRPLMERHDLRGSLPRGVFFRSRLHRENGRVSVRPEVYVLRTPENAGFIRHIEGGVYRETSIGFAFQKPECVICAQDIRRCGHTPGQTYDGVTCHYLMRGVKEVIEGSVVPAGSQGTGFVARGGVDAEAPTLAMARRWADPAALAPLTPPERAWADE